MATRVIDKLTLQGFRAESVTLTEMVGSSLGASLRFACGRSFQLGLRRHQTAFFSLTDCAESKPGCDSFFFGWNLRPCRKSGWSAPGSSAAEAVRETRCLA